MIKSDEENFKKKKTIQELILQTVKGHTIFAAGNSLILSVSFLPESRGVWLHAVPSKSSKSNWGIYTPVNT